MYLWVKRLAFQSDLGCVPLGGSGLRIVTQDHTDHGAFKEWSLRVRSFDRIPIRISDLRLSFRANPFWDQWFIKSTLDKDSSDHWSNAFLTAMDSKIIILPSGAQFQTGRYLIYEKNFRDVSRVRDFCRGKSPSWVSGHNFLFYLFVFLFLFSFS